MADIGITVNYHIDTYNIDCLIDAAFYGGIGYWCSELRVDKKPTEQITALSEAVTRGGILGICEEDDFDRRWHTFGMDEVIVGLQRMAVEYPNAFNDFMIDNADASTGDIFVQLAIFGEVVYS